MNPLEEECSRLTMESRTLHLPNNGCVERQRRLARSEEGVVLNLNYTQQPGFFLPGPYDTQQSIPTDVTMVRYFFVPCHGNVQVRIPSLSDDPDHSYGK